MRALVVFESMFGNAAGRRLRKMGFRAIVPAESYWVTGTTGPLFPGELDRARAWGSAVGSAMVARALARS